MSWAQRLERVFGIDIETCPAGGAANNGVIHVIDSVILPNSEAGDSVPGAIAPGTSRNCQTRVTVASPTGFSLRDIELWSFRYASADSTVVCV